MMRIGGDGPIADGDQNLVAGRDIVISVKEGNQYAHSASHFAGLDARYARDVHPEKKLLRGNTDTNFSAEGLFTSLVRIGLGYDDAFGVVNGTVSVLADQRTDTDDDEWIPSTLDIRTAVMRVLSGLAEDGKHSSPQVDLWFAAYLRRYGTPVNQFVRVIDHDSQKDLDFEYIKKTILPHVFCRIIGLNRLGNPFEKYPSVFSGTVIGQMARAVIQYTNTLNLYSIRYKTLINLLQDIILEPPHPWIVNEQAIQDIVAYNMERANAHHIDTGTNAPIYRFEYSIRECFQHSCAAILAAYGAFLGVDSKYGLCELRRVLRFQHQTPDMWHFCRLSEMPADFKAIDCQIYDFARQLDRITDLLASRPSPSRRDHLRTYAESVLTIATQLVALDG